MPYYSKHWYIANYSDEDVERLNGVGCIWKGENVVSFTKRMDTTGIKKLVKSPAAHFEPQDSGRWGKRKPPPGSIAEAQMTWSKARGVKREAEQLRAEQLRAKQLRAKEIRDKKRNPPPGSIAEAQMTWWRAQEVARKAARSNAAGAPERGDV